MINVHVNQSTLIFSMNFPKTKGENKSGFIILQTSLALYKEFNTLLKSLKIHPLTITLEDRSLACISYLCVTTKYEKYHLHLNSTILTHCTK